MTDIMTNQKGKNMKYYVEDHGETAEDAIDLGDGEYGHNSETAETAAEYEHDMWGAQNDDEWPLCIALIDDIGIVSKWLVGREMKMVFSAIGGMRSITSERNEHEQ